MKNLSNCKPSEFLRQTVLIRRAVEKWLSDTNILNIRKRIPVFDVVPKGATAEERIQIAEANQKKAQEQLRRNVYDIIDAICEKCPEGTVEIMALCCFVEPSAADEYPMSYYLNQITDLLNDEAVLSFFTSLVRLGQINSSEPVNQ